MLQKFGEAGTNCQRQNFVRAVRTIRDTTLGATGHPSEETVDNSAGELWALQRYNYVTVNCAADTTDQLNNYHPTAQQTQCIRDLSWIDM